MSPPPAKRQKRRVVSSSDDDNDDDDNKTPVPPNLEKHKVRKNVTRLTSSVVTAKQSLPTRSRAKPTESIKERSQWSAAIQTTPTCPDTTGTSSKSPNRRSKAPIKSQGSKPISNFFGTAVQRQKTPKATLPEVENDAADLIEDDSPIEVLDEPSRPQHKIKSIPDRQRVRCEDNDNVSSGSQRFKLAGNAMKGAADKQCPKPEVHLTPWAERFGPSNLEELMVHKRKVSDIQTWLDNVLQGRQAQVCQCCIPSPFND